MTGLAIKHGTIGEFAPELVPYGVLPDAKAAVVRRGGRVALVPYPDEVADMLTGEGLDKVVTELADAEFDAEEAR